MEELVLAGSPRRGAGIAPSRSGFGSARPPVEWIVGTYAGVLGHVGLIQIDSVNVLVRSQELVAFARLGPHQRSLIPDATTDARGVVRVLGPRACHVPVEQHPLYPGLADGKRCTEWEEAVDGLRQRRPEYRQ